MGAPKLLLELEGEPLLARAVRTAAAVDPCPTVVLRRGDDEARHVLAGHACRIVVNDRPDREVAGSIARGIDAVRAWYAASPGTVSVRGASPPVSEGGSDRVAVLVLLPDMPFVTRATLVTLAERYRALPDRAPSSLFYVTARYGEVLAPPVILPPPLLPLLSDATGSLRHRLRDLGVRAEPVDLPEQALLDVDTPDDRARLLRDSTSSD
jgi:CTP:molybdopterin cytidylyltransferase MocA